MARRGRLLVGLLVLASAVILLSGCGGAPKTKPVEKTELKITITTYRHTSNSSSNGDRKLYRTTTYTLSCPSSRGTLPDAAAACDRLTGLKATDLRDARSDLKIARLPQKDADYTEITIGGRLRGQVIRFSGSILNGKKQPEIYRRWRDVIGPQTIDRLLPPPQKDSDTDLVQKSAPTQLKITITTYRYFIMRRGSMPHHRRQSYTLSCPAGRGTLPAAAAVCQRLAPRKLVELNNPRQDTLVGRIPQNDADYTQVAVSGRFRGRPIRFAGGALGGDVTPKIRDRWLEIIGEPTVNQLMPAMTDKQIDSDAAHLEILIQTTSPLVPILIKKLQQEPHSSARHQRLQLALMKQLSRIKRPAAYTLDCPRGRSNLKHPQAVCRRLKREIQGPLSEQLYKQAPRSSYSTAGRPSALEVRGIIEGRPVSYYAIASDKEEGKIYRLWLSIIGKDRPSAH